MVGRRRSKVLSTQRRMKHAMQSMRKRRILGKLPLTCPRCYDTKLRAVRGKQVITFVCSHCKLSETMPKHPVKQLIDQYNNLCDYVRTGKEPIFQYKELKKEVYESLLEHITLGTIIVEEVI